MTKTPPPLDVARCANARQCELDGECLRSIWYDNAPRTGTPGLDWGDCWATYIAPPPCNRPSPHLCGWYLEER
ncbi:hypothetical protein H8E07_13335 [bacterium]|nr:hypothetical protein [bacterium]